MQNDICDVDLYTLRQNIKSLQQERRGWGGDKADGDISKQDGHEDKEEAPEAESRVRRRRGRRQQKGEETCRVMEKEPRGSQVGGAGTFEVGQKVNVGGVAQMSRGKSKSNEDCAFLHSTRLHRSMESGRRVNFVRLSSAPVRFWQM